MQTFQKMLTLGNFFIGCVCILIGLLDMFLIPEHYWLIVLTILVGFINIGVAYVRMQKGLI